MASKQKIKKAEDLTFNSLKRIYNNATEDYKSKVGKYERGDDLVAFGSPIIEYTSIMNEFISSLVQLVAFPIFQSHMWTNRLQALKKGNKPYGFDIEDIYSNPVNPTPYDATDFTRILKGTKQDTITAFYRENRHDVFQKTITKDMLRGAFKDVVAFQEFIDTLVTTIYAGNEIEEYNLTKRAINECYDASMFITKALDISSAEGIQAGIEDIKNAYEHFQFPSTAYNNYATFSGTDIPAKVWTNPEDIVILAKIDVINAMKVKYLAGVFNLSEVEFRERLILVDDFGWDEYEVNQDGVTGDLKKHHDSDIQMVVCDSGLFQIYDTIEVSTEFFNAGNLATNFFLHVWQTYGMRPWANALVFTAESIDEITLSGNDIELTSASVTGTLTYTPTTAEIEISKVKTFIYDDVAGGYIVSSVNLDTIVSLEKTADGTITATYDTTAELPTGVTAGDGFMILYNINGNDVTVNITLAS